MDVPVVPPSKNGMCPHFEKTFLRELVDTNSSEEYYLHGVLARAK